MNSKYRSCFNCNMRPATIKCLTCKVLKSNESIQKLCYICDKNIHQQNSNHNKDLIPFNEMKTEIRRINSTIQSDHFSSIKTNNSENYSSSFNNEKNIREAKKKEVVQKIHDLNIKLSPKREKINFVENSNFNSNNSFLNKNQINKDYSSSFLNTNYQDKQNNFNFYSEINQRSTKISSSFEKNNVNYQEKKEKLNQMKLHYEEENRNLEQKIKNTLDKNEKFSIEIEEMSGEYENQIENLKSSLQTIRNQYENKLKDFEKSIKSSSETVKTLQAQIKLSKKDESEEVKSLRNQLKEKNDSILKFEKLLNEKKSEFESVSGSYQGQMTDLDKKISELSALNDIKHQEIEKLNEVVKNFEELYKHYNEEKELLTAENKKLGEELLKFSEYLNNELIEEEEEEQDIPEQQNA